MFYQDNAHILLVNFAGGFVFDQIIFDFISHHLSSVLTIWFVKIFWPFEIFKHRFLLSFAWISVSCWIQTENNQSNETQNHRFENKTFLPFNCCLIACMIAHKIFTHIEFIQKYLYIKSVSSLIWATKIGGINANEWQY